MKYSETLQGQFEAMMKKKQRKIESVIVKALEQMLPVWIDALIDQASGFEFVTGNAITGYFAGAYLPIGGKMTLVAAEFSGNELEPPTRLWLKKGEAYNLPYYYSGAPVEGEPFVGTIGRRNRDSLEEGIKFLQSHKPKKSPLSFIVGNSVDYGVYLDTRSKTNLLTDFCDDMKSKGWIVEMHGK